MQINKNFMKFRVTYRSNMNKEKSDSIFHNLLIQKIIFMN